MVCNPKDKFSCHMGHLWIGEWENDSITKNEMFSDNILEHYCAGDRAVLGFDAEHFYTQLNASVN